MLQKIQLVIQYETATIYISVWILKFMEYTLIQTIAAVQLNFKSNPLYDAALNLLDQKEMDDQINDE